ASSARRDVNLDPSPEPRPPGSDVDPQTGYSRTSADVAQLVEHFTRNEGVPGSSPGVGFERGPRISRLVIAFILSLRWYMACTTETWSARLSTLTTRAGAF